MTSTSGSFTNAGDAVTVDKDGVPHYNRDPAHGEEWEESAILGLASCLTQESRKAYPMRLKNALNGRAWTMCHKKDEITASKLSETASRGLSDPTRRRACS